MDSERRPCFWGQALWSIYNENKAYFNNYFILTFIQINFFKVYTFLMVCLNIPVFIFSLSMLLLTLPKSPQWIHIVVPMVDILFSLCELIGLTIIPAKIHTRVSKFCKIFEGKVEESQNGHFQRK
jgi:hypothetical protein